jgi:HK97 gp10 family phage protein
MSIEFQGLENVIGRIENITNPEAINRALGKACAIVERAAKQKAPKGTGELRRSITSKVENLQGIVYTPLEYAPYVEYGTGIYAENGGREDVPWRYQDDEGEWHSTVGQHPQPYMRPALDENREQIIRLLREALLNND